MEPRQMHPSLEESVTAQRFSVYTGQACILMSSLSSLYFISSEQGLEKSHDLSLILSSSEKENGKEFA
jgi:hypothetical protein